MTNPLQPGLMAPEMQNSSPSSSSPVTTSPAIGLFLQNGVSSKDNSLQTNGNEPSHHQNPLNNPSNPLTPAAPTESQPPTNESTPSIKLQSIQQEAQTDSETGVSQKKDLYVGNLYFPGFISIQTNGTRHPRVQPQMLKDLFGGEATVESVKIVPDRNVFPFSSRSY